MKRYYVYVSVMVAVILTLAIVLNFCPRSSFAELERRELSHFPEFTWDSLTSGEYTKAVSRWYSDTEPFRDQWMEASLQLRKTKALEIGGGEEQVAFISGDSDEKIAIENSSENKSSYTDDAPVDLEGKVEMPDLDAQAKIANHGIIVVGSAPNARALMAYRGKGGGYKYADVINKYKARFGDAVNIYCMAVPTSVTFYCPEKAQSTVMPESVTFDGVRENLDSTIYWVDLISVLSKHTSEGIYLRTDHHWAPLGAFYAAREFARIAGVPFHELSAYERRVSHGFVGTMYGYSRDISVKKSPEDFVYWVPLDTSYMVTYTTYNIDEKYQVIGEHKSRPSKKYFYPVRDGGGNAYSTFMGGDAKITQVNTTIANGRRLMILKDSFGNAIPSWLFGSFEEIHVVDFRYFTKNMVQYVNTNKITDILFCNNSFKVYSGCAQYLTFLDQQEGGEHTKTKN